MSAWCLWWAYYALTRQPLFWYISTHPKLTEKSIFNNLMYCTYKTSSDISIFFNFHFLTIIKQPKMCSQYACHSELKAVACILLIQCILQICQWIKCKLFTTIRNTELNCGLIKIISRKILISNKYFTLFTFDDINIFQRSSNGFWTFMQLFCQKKSQFLR